VDTLIAGCGKRTATLLQVLKDTGARVSEAVRIQRKHIDYARREITIAKPSKGSNSRTVRVSEKCLAMIRNMSDKYGPYIFSPNVDALRSSFNISREKLAQKLNDDNLRKVHFHSLRHFKGAKTQRDYHESDRTQYIMGHKNPQNTEFYKHYEHNHDSDGWVVKRPLNAKQEDELISQGFQFVRLDETEGHPIYRKKE
jgi:integrase